MRLTSPNQTKVNAAIPLAALLFLGALAALSVALVRPPEAVPETAPLDAFSSGRAMKHLREIARAPHPAGTEEHERVREYIVRELNALGVSPEVQTATVVRKSRGAGGLAVAARVHNVVARLGGSRNSKALMLAVHYDSVPTAPGATDDGAGVSALLETLRVLKSSSALKNDIIFLFTDAEELGLLGARAFADEHPWMRDVALVLNFEGRGNSGPSMMFETSTGNGLLIRELAQAAPHTVANSLMYAVYERMPNDTDMTVFKQAGAAGLNFAYAAEVTHYHTMLDSPEEIDERSLQHHGSYALSLARHFGNLDLGETRARDAVYFNALGTLFVHYSEAWVWPLTILVAASLILVLRAGRKRNLLNAAGVAWGFVALFVAGVLSSVVTIGAWRAARSLHAGSASLPAGVPYNAWLYEIGFVLLSVALAAAVYALFARRASAQNLLAGALVWWLLLLLLTSALLPLGSYLFAWPLLFSLAGLAFVLIWGGGDYAAPKNIAALTLCSIPGVMLVAPLVYMFFMMLGVGLAGFIIILTVLLVGLVAPLLILPSSTKRWALPLSLAIAAIVFVAAGIATAGFDARSRKTASLFYYLNADANEARWMSTDSALDEWTAQFIPRGANREALASIFPWSRQQAWRSTAPALALAPPRVEIAEDNMQGDVRQVRLRLVSPRRASLLLIYFDSDTEVLSAALDGKSLEGAGAGTNGSSLNPLRISFAAPPADGIELKLEVRAARPLKLTVQDVSYGLPTLPGQTNAPRPPDSMPAPSSTASDTTIVGKTFNFERR